MRRILFAVLMTCCLSSMGCDGHGGLNSDESSSARSSAGEPSGVNARAKEEITRVLEADQYLGKSWRRATRSVGDAALEQEGATSLRQTLVTNMSKIPLDGVPEEFKNAYLRHIDAWANGSSVGISATWMEVQAAAQRNGVVWDQ